MTINTYAKQEGRRIPTSIYWIVTSLVAVNFLFGGITGLLQIPAAIKVMVRLGYPAYFGTYLAVWELLAVVALVVPGPRIFREWAYAGLVFNTLSAIYSLGWTGSAFAQMLPALFMLGLVMVSYCGWRQRKPIL